MRPVCKGVAPHIYARYQEAIGDLESVLDLYCSYCERRFPAGLEVEHVSPKSLGGALTNWQNFLLGCKTCNTAKWNKPASQATALWPDSDNTLLALSYSVGGFVALAPALPAAVEALATKLVQLVGLDRHDATHGKKPTKRDKRWFHRDEAWKLATGVRADYDIVFPVHPQQALNSVVNAALGYGFFSVWMTVFRDVPVVRSSLVNVFKGTALDCFDAQGAPVKRPQGRI